LRRIVTLALAGLCLAGPLAAQRGRDSSPRRPPLGEAADTNSAMAYYTHGANVLERSPAEAAASFWWASRLNPGWADALYGEYVARLLMDKNRLVGYMDGQRSTLRSRDIQHIDSLYWQARTFSPFLVRRFDRALLATYLQTWVENEARRDDPGSHPDAGWIDHQIRIYLDRDDNYVGAWMAASQGNFPEAARRYQTVLQRARYKSGLRADLARVHYQMGAYDLALEALRQSMAEWRREDKEERGVILYQSKAVLEHSIGMIHEQKGDTAAAREAYGRALQEDISYFPAHLRLSALALAGGDSVTATAEMDLAVQIAAEDPYLHLQNGMMLASARRFQEAMAEFQKATQINPDYATPYFVMARMYDGSGMAEEAAANYRSFLDHAARSDPQAEAVRQRVAQLAAETAGAAQPAAPVQPPPPAL
jgi:tetratricopeptide (TPR) repeat protein